MLHIFKENRLRNISRLSYLHYVTDCAIYQHKSKGISTASTVSTAVERMPDLNVGDDLTVETTLDLNEGDDLTVETTRLSTTQLITR